MCVCAFVSGMPRCVKKIEYNTVNVGIKNEYLYIYYDVQRTYYKYIICMCGYMFYMYKSICYDNLLQALQAIVRTLFKLCIHRINTQAALLLLIHHIFSSLDGSIMHKTR